MLKERKDIENIEEIDAVVGLIFKRLIRELQRYITFIDEGMKKNEEDTIHLLVKLQYNEHTLAVEFDRKETPELDGVFGLLDDTDTPALLFFDNAIYNKLTDFYWLCNMYNKRIKILNFFYKGIKSKALKTLEELSGLIEQYFFRSKITIAHEVQHFIDYTKGYLEIELEQYRDYIENRKIKAHMSRYIQEIERERTDLENEYVRISRQYYLNSSKEYNAYFLSGLMEYYYDIKDNLIPKDILIDFKKFYKHFIDNYMPEYGEGLESESINKKIKNRLYAFYTEYFMNKEAKKLIENCVKNDMWEEAELLLERFTNNKTIYVFDVDDTLLRSSSKIRYREPGKDWQEADTSEFAEIRTKLDKNVELDFGDFRDYDKMYNKLTTAEPEIKGLKFVDEAVRNQYRIGILTARGSQKAVYNALSKWLRYKSGDRFYPVPPTLFRKKYVWAVNDADTKNWITSQSKQEGSVASPEYLKAFVLEEVFVNQYGFDRVVFFDDDERNIEVVRKLNHPKIQAVLVK